MEKISLRWNKTGNLGSTVRIYLKRKNSQSIIRTISSNAPNSGSFVWKPQAHDGEYVIYISVNADAANPSQASSTSSPFNLKGLDPDLHINWVKVEPRKKNVKTQITFRASIYNAGILKAKATTAELRIKGPINRKIKLPFGELAGHKTNILTYKYNLPQYGIYRNILTLDINKDLYSRNPRMASEKNLANNKKEITYGVNPLCDLVIVAKKYQHVKLHRKQTITVKVKNIGDTPAPKSQLRFWIQKKGSKNFMIPSLKPGKSFVVRRKEYWITSGKRKFSAEIDYKGRVKEKSDTNNKFTGVIQKGGKYSVQNKEVSSADM